jgi:PAS domain S-box-containing protein
VTKSRALGMRMTRACVTVAAIGLVLTASCFVVARDVESRLNHQRVERPADAALLGVQQLSAAVDQVLSTAGGVVAATGGDPLRFDAVLGPDVDSSPTLAGIALVERVRGADRVVTSVGDTTLLAGRSSAAIAADVSATLIAHRRTRSTFDLGVAASVPGGRAVFLQIAVPSTSSLGASFVLTSGAGTRADDVTLGNAETTAGMTRWNGTVVLAGRPFALFVRPDEASWLADAQLPPLTLLVGLVLTAIAAWVAASVVRRKHAVGLLRTENRELDRAIEQQRKIEAELRASQARFRAMLRDSPDAIAILHVDHGALEILNRVDFLGHPVEDLRGPDGLLRLVHGDDRDAARAAFESLRSLRGDQIFESTLRLQDADGHDRFVRLRFSPLSASEDGAGTLLGLLSDVSEAWENQLREAELEEALRQSQRLESIGRLAGGVAHDFNNLLAAIQASAELLEDAVPPGRPEEYRQEIERAAQRGAALTRQLLTFAHRDRTVARSVDLVEVVSGIESLLRRSLSAVVQLRITTPDEPCAVFVDPTRLEQVIFNLALNARDAMPDGGELSISVRVDLVDDADRRVVLSVTDTGTGIDQEVRDRIFDPFVTTKEPGKGTGIGLATVRTIAESAGATIDVFSRPGEGTTFEIAFPRCAPGPENGSPPDADDDLDGLGRRILVVEDEDAVRAVIAHTLERRRFEVTVAASAIEALQVVERESFDLVLTDLMMPEMTGRELIERLAASRPTQRVVAMSGYSSDEGEVPADAVQILAKPFTNAQLFAAIRDALRADAPSRVTRRGSLSALQGARADGR